MIQPLCGVYSKSCLQKFKTCLEEKQLSLKKIILEKEEEASVVNDKLSSNIISIPDDFFYERDVFYNVNKFSEISGLCFKV